MNINGRGPIRTNFAEVVDRNVLSLTDPYERRASFIVPIPGDFLANEANKSFRYVREDHPVIFIYDRGDGECYFLPCTKKGIADARHIIQTEDVSPMRILRVTSIDLSPVEEVDPGVWNAKTKSNWPEDETCVTLLSLHEIDGLTHDIFASPPCMRH